jgi:hypothetical protein
MARGFMASLDGLILSSTAMRAAAQLLDRAARRAVR